MYLRSRMRGGTVSAADPPHGRADPNHLPARGGAAIPSRRGQPASHRDGSPVCQVGRWLWAATLVCGGGGVHPSRPPMGPKPGE